MNYVLPKKHRLTLVALVTDPLRLTGAFWKIFGSATSSFHMQLFLHFELDLLLPFVKKLPAQETNLSTVLVPGQNT